MKKIVTGALAALSLAGAAVGTATPAAAQPWHGGGYHGGYGGYRGWGPGAAVGAGLVGLAVGESLAPHYGYGYGAPYYGPGYYAPAYGYGYGYGCRVVGRWGPWSYHRARACY